MPNINDAFPSNYLKAGDLKGRAVIVTIDRVEFEPVGQKREMKPVMYFHGKEKGVVLNKTNANKIMQITSSPVTEEWAGWPIVLYPTETSFQGDMVDCIRVRQAPNGTPRRTPPPAVSVSESEEDGFDGEATMDDSDIPF